MHVRVHACTRAIGWTQVCDVICSWCHEHRLFYKRYVSPDHIVIGLVCHPQATSPTRDTPRLSSPQETDKIYVNQKKEYSICHVTSTRQHWPSQTMFPYSTKRVPFVRRVTTVVTGVPTSTFMTVKTHKCLCPVVTVSSGTSQSSEMTLEVPSRARCDPSGVSPTGKVTLLPSHERAVRRQKHIVLLKTNTLCEMTSCIGARGKKDTRAA